MKITEPSLRALRAIEREWPLIAAELALLDAEIAEASRPHGRPVPDELAVRRSRRASRSVAGRSGGLDGAA